MTSSVSVLSALWSFLLAISWLLPNHYLPWTSFHSEFWAAASLLALVPFAVIKAPRRYWLSSNMMWIAAVATIPMFQFAAGQINYFGHAWICSLYLLGLFVAVLTGYFWESAAEPGSLIDMLSLAIGIGALCSVGLQLYQWLGLEGLGLWLVDSSGFRPSANFAQLNQLATFLVWGVLATFWGFVRAKIGGWVAILLSGIFLFGIALTASRSAWIAVILIVFCACWWRQLWASKRTTWSVAALGVYFAVCAHAFRRPGLSELIEKSVGSVLEPSGVAFTAIDARFSAWKLFVGAALDRPIAGYGWGQIAEAHIFSALEHPPLHVVFSQSHNLFLDLVLWCGLPVGLLISVGLARWLWRLFRGVDSPESAILFLLVLVLANHSMFEYPLQYAYFLLPLGLVVGTVEARKTAIRVPLYIGKAGMTALWLVSALMLSATFIDYLKVENSYRLLRMEWAGFLLERNPQPPPVIALTQWHHILKQSRVVPRKDMSEADLHDITRALLEAHRPIDFLLLAKALYLNGSPDEARRWLARLCSVESIANCKRGNEEFDSLLFRHQE